MLDYHAMSLYEKPRSILVLHGCTRGPKKGLNVVRRLENNDENKQLARNLVCEFNRRYGNRYNTYYLRMEI